MIPKKKYIIGCDMASDKDRTVISWIRDDGYIESLIKPPDMEEIRKTILEAFKIPKEYWGRV
jgi:hypothetical protein